MKSVSIEILVPKGANPLDHRDKVQARACELGWPEPHSAGTCFAYDHLIVDLAWNVNDVGIDDVIATLEEEFYVRNVFRSVRLPWED
jgi:hypothetical protein